jgi:hypothetical protein
MLQSYYLCLGTNIHRQRDPQYSLETLVRSVTLYLVWLIISNSRIETENPLKLRIYFWNLGIQSAQGRKSQN